MPLVIVAPFVNLTEQSIYLCIYCFVDRRIHLANSPTTLPASVHFLPLTPHSRAASGKKDWDSSVYGSVNRTFPF